MLSVFYASLGAEPQAARLAVSERSTPLPPRLSDTGLYLAGAVTMLRADHIAFAPQYPLCSDGTSKRRWIYLAGGAGQIPLTESDILGPSEAFRAPMDYYSHTPDTTAILERLARE